jgi:NAD(P)H-dependent FMN reductase
LSTCPRSTSRSSSAAPAQAVTEPRSRPGCWSGLLRAAPPPIPSSTSLDEPVPALAGRYEHQHTKDWSATIAPYDGFVFVTPEYNHSTSPALLNALDYLYAEWNNKAAGFVSYGTSYGVRAVEHLRGVVGELQMADVRAQVRLSMYTDFTNRVFTPGPEHDAEATQLFDQLERWAGALKTARS